MSAGDFQALRSVPLEVANALARYERHVRKLATTWLDMELYATVSEEVDVIRRYCAGFPDLSLAATALLISHAELIHALWRRGEHPEGDNDVAVRLQDHLACIDTLARRCLRLLERDDESSPHD